MRRYSVGLRSALLAGASLLVAGSAFAQTSGPRAGAGSAPDTAAQPANSPGQAQDSATGQAAPENQVVVVGSQIRGARITGALPVTVVGQDEITATGAVSGDELFRSIPQAGDVQFQEARTTGNLNDARGDVASINLRSLGTGNTLVLLNGRRMVFAPGTQTENFVPVQTVNTNSIPVGAIRRLEVLREGAAAIYGTDAVAGVVNVVLDDRFQGLQLQARYGASQNTGYGEGVLSFKAGGALGDGTHLSLFGSYTNHTRMLAGDRPYSASENHLAAVANTPWAGDTAFDNRSTSSPWGSFTVVPSSTVVRQNNVALTASGVFHVEPVSNTAAGCSSTVYADNLCLRSGGITGAADRPLRYDENPNRTLKGNLNRYNLFGAATHDFGPVEGFSEAAYYHAVFDGRREQSAPLSTAPITIPASNYWNPFGPTTFNGLPNPNRLPGLTGVPTTGLAMTITNYRPVDAGYRTYTVTDDSYRLLGGLRGDRFGFHWESALTYSWARTDDNTHNAISNTLFQAALARSTPDAYNPFNGGNPNAYSLEDTTLSNAETIRSFLVEVHRISYTSLLSGDFKVSRPDLFHLPGGDVGLAAGVEVRRETFQDQRDPRLNGTTTYTDIVTGRTFGTDIVGASPSPNVKADRSVASAYLELAVPVISPEMHIPLVQSFDVQLAARDERYSDFGNVLKPKIAAVWKLTDWLSLRGSAEQGFRAPNLPQFYSDGTTVSNTRTDYAFCRLNNTTCAGASTTEIRVGNKDLQPEEAKEKSAGVVFQSSFLPIRYGRITATVDYWSIDETNVIGIEDAPTQILYDLLLRTKGSSNPGVVRLPPAAGQSVGQLSFVNEPYMNLQPREAAGVDFEVDYDLRHTPFGDFSLQLNAAKLTKLLQRPDPVQQQVIEANNAGLFGPGIAVTSAGNQIRINGNPRWRSSATLTWRLGALQAGAFVDYVGKVYDTGPSLQNGQFFEVSSWTTVSLYGQYNFENVGAFSKTSLRLGVRNVADKDPPIASNNFGYLGQLHNALGRYWYANLTKRF